MLKLEIVFETSPVLLRITTSCKSRSMGSGYCQKRVTWSVLWPADKLNILLGLAVLPRINCDFSAVTPLISLFRGVILITKVLTPELEPRSMLLMVNLTLPSSSTPVAATFTVLNVVKSGDSPVSL